MTVPVFLPVQLTLRALCGSSGKQDRQPSACGHSSAVSPPPLVGERVDDARLCAEKVLASRGRWRREQRVGYPASASPPATIPAPRPTSPPSPVRVRRSRHAAIPVSAPSGRVAMYIFIAPPLRRAPRLVHACVGIHTDEMQAPVADTRVRQREKNPKPTRRSLTLGTGGSGRLRITWGIQGLDGWRSPAPPLPGP